MNIIILGAGGFGKEVAFIIDSFIKKKEKSNGVVSKLLGYIDETLGKQGQIYSGYPVLGDFSYIEEIEEIELDKIRFVSSIGDIDGRKKFIKKALKYGLKPFESIIFPNVVHSHFISMGEGTIVCPNCVITVDVEIGCHVHIHSDSTIGHDVKIDNFSNISPGVHICGRVKIGECVDIGTGANILPGVTIGSYAVIGAGALVKDDIEPGVVAVGVPAKPIKKNKIL
jgi:sugar O-acyltransferase (sialic acid O-acetyltransferase NeuD family)